VFGTGQNPNSAYAAAIPKFLDKFVRGARPVIPGDGEQTRDADVSKAAVELEFRAETSLADGLAQTIEAVEIASGA
jgi:UDP-glucose 4-epimerase